VHHTIGYGRSHWPIDRTPSRRLASGRCPDRRRWPSPVALPWDPMGWRPAGMRRPTALDARTRIGGIALSFLFRLLNQAPTILPGSCTAAREQPSNTACRHGSAVARGAGSDPDATSGAAHATTPCHQNGSAGESPRQPRAVLTSTLDDPFSGHRSVVPRAWVPGHPSKRGRMESLGYRPERGHLRISRAGMRSRDTGRAVIGG